jgi:RNA polymerase sigma-70 factor, ECF subfamily
MDASKFQKLGIIDLIAGRQIRCIQTPFAGVSVVKARAALKMSVEAAQILWQIKRAGLDSGPGALAGLETMMQDTDELQAELLRRIAAQDRDALSEFYDQTARPLFSIACRMLGNAADAEEVIQDVFVQIWTKAGMFDAKKGQPFHWVLALTRNRCIDGLRARQRRSRIVVDTSGELELDQAVEPAPVDSPLMENESAVIQSVVNKLPKDQRQAIEMAFFGGLTHQEIAESLNEPLGTVKARIRRGMLKLRDALQNYL